MHATATASTIPGATRGHSTASQERLDLLDQLRGLAALAVVVAHGWTRSAPISAELMFTWFDLGHFGVILFFLCSGFIIPVSLERHGSLGRFWIRRLCRLYPLYWLSIALVLLGYHQGWLAASDQIAMPTSNASLALNPAWTVLANLTMLQGFVGIPGLLGVYWTLFYEMLFYGIVSLLFAAGQQQHTAVTTSWFALTASSAAGVQLLLGERIFPVELLSYPAIMFSGTLLYRVRQGTATPLHAALAIGLVLLMLLVTTQDDTTAGTAMPALHLLTARLSAFGIFIAALWRHWHAGPAASIAQGVGRWSYSLYLMHTFVFVVIPPLGSPLLTICAWTSGSIVLSALTYRWVEQPAIALGQRLTRTPAAAPALADRVLSARDDTLHATAQAE